MTCAGDQRLATSFILLEVKVIKLGSIEWIASVCTEGSAFGVLFFSCNELNLLESLCALHGSINCTCKWSVPGWTRLDKCIFHFSLVWQWIEIADCDLTSAYLEAWLLLLGVVNSHSRSATHFIFLMERRVEHLTTTSSNWEGSCFISSSVITASKSWKLSRSQPILKLWLIFTWQVLRRKTFLYRLEIKTYFTALCLCLFVE